MSEHDARSTHPTHWLIRAAAHRAPVTLSARLEEEWLAHLDACRTPWSALCLAAGCWWTSAVIARDHEGDKVREGVAALCLSNGVVTFGEPKLRYLSLRPGTLFLIVELQAALLCGLVLPL